MIQFSLYKSAWLARQGGRGSHWWETNCLWLVILCRWCHHRPPPGCTPLQPPMWPSQNYCNLQSMNDSATMLLTFTLLCLIAQSSYFFSFLSNVKNSYHPLLWLEESSQGSVGKVISVKDPHKEILEKDLRQTVLSMHLFSGNCPNSFRSGRCPWISKISNLFWWWSLLCQCWCDTRKEFAQDLRVLLRQRERKS